MAGASADAITLARHLAGRELAPPDRLLELYGSDVARQLEGVLLRPGSEHEDFTINWAESLIDSSDWPMRPNLVPFMTVDEKSFACVVAAYADDGSVSLGSFPSGSVVRWHLDTAKDHLQGALLDTDPLTYAQSVADELARREVGLARMVNEIGPAYELQYLEAEKRPRDFVIRPVRIACQNVIVGLAAFAQDSSIDGLSVLAWQTCEVPHVATHEANRALAALMLCDAFARGGTLEIRFDRRAKLTAEGVTPKSGEVVSVDVEYLGHPERQVPASLRRYGRTVEVELGKSDPGAISPTEARALFLAVTPMPEGLAGRVRDAYERGVATPERMCFAVLSQIWREVELDFMLAVSDRAGSILRGGADWTHRGQRQAESDLARAALMVGMLFRRLDTKDGAGGDTAGEARALEDNRVGVTWTVLPDEGAVVYRGLRGEPAPWQDFPTGSGPHMIHEDGTLVVLPRPSLDADALAVAAGLAGLGPVAVVIPADAGAEEDPAIAAEAAVLLLRCPDRMGELDQAIEQKLLKARISRA